MSKIIALDAGHGLNTAGKQTPDGIKEYIINDKVRDKIVGLLNPYDVKFLFPDNDEGNVDESLTSRKAMYINGYADVAVSIHHNALTGKWNDATGIEVYVDRNATEADLRLAQLIHDKLAAYTGLKGRGVKRANFTVIYQNKIPAVLVEGGFMDGNNDYKVITSEQGQDAYARAVAESLIEFCNLEKKETVQQTASQPTPTPTPAEPQNGYLVKVTCDVLNVRKGPGTNYVVATTVKKGEVYTIVGEDNGWGQLKSGAGWIKLSYTTKITSGSAPAVSTPKPAAKTLSVGSKVKIKSSAAKYCTGQKIPGSIKGKSYTVQQIGTTKYPNGVLLKEIVSWVNKSDLEF